MSLLDTASLVITPNGTKAGTLYSVVPSDGSGDMTVTRATTATRVNSAGLIESVASNVPRLDYSNGTCPSILVEPQRTNLVLYSEDFTNASWDKFNSATITANTSVSPDGNTTADTLSFSANANSCIYKSLSVSSNSYTATIYVKVNTGTKKFRLRFDNPTAEASSDFTATTTWQRFTFTVSGSPTGFYVINELAGIAGDIQIWGAQLEAGSYATSYIPTTSASVTRNADVISKTGISSLIGQTEGTMFLDLEFNNVDQTNGLETILSLNDGTELNYINLFLDTPSGNPKQLLVLIRDAGAFNGIIADSNLITATRYKIALGYKNNDVILYVNGTQVGSDTSTNIPATSAINFNNTPTSGFVNIQQEYINTSALWKTRLTNTQLAQLTTI